MLISIDVIETSILSKGKAVSLYVKQVGREGGETSASLLTHIQESLVEGWEIPSTEILFMKQRNSGCGEENEIPGGWELI